MTILLIVLNVVNLITGEMSVRMIVLAVTKEFATGTVVALMDVTRSITTLTTKIKWYTDVSVA